MPIHAQSVNIVEQVAVLADGQTLSLKEYRYAWLCSGNGQAYRFSIEGSELVLATDSYPPAVRAVEKALPDARWVAASTTRRGYDMVTRFDTFSVGDLGSVDASHLFHRHAEAEVSLGLIVDVLL